MCIIKGSLFFSLYLQVLAPGCGSSSLCQGGFHNSFQTITGFNNLFTSFYQSERVSFINICVTYVFLLKCLILEKKITGLYLLPQIVLINESHMAYIITIFFRSLIVFVECINNEINCRTSSNGSPNVRREGVGGRGRRYVLLQQLLFYTADPSACAGPLDDIRQYKLKQ